MAKYLCKLEELKLAIFDNIPLPIWACDRDCKIVFWNKGAEQLYLYTEEEALGKDYVELFVNPPEQERAREDCKKIIDDNFPIQNMADDIDKFHNPRRLITHCFPLYNAGDFESLQVEISHEVASFEKLNTELIELQASYKEKEAMLKESERMLVVKMKEGIVCGLDSRIKIKKDELVERDRKIMELEYQRLRSEDNLGQHALEVLTSDLKKERDILHEKHNALLAKIYECLDKDALKLVEREINAEKI